MGSTALFELPPLVDVKVTGPAPIVIPISCPSRVWINKIIVEQTDGPGPTAFTVELFNNKAVMPNQVSESMGPDEVGIVPEGCYAICPPIASDSPGVLRHFSENATGGRGYGFVCTDPDARNIKSQGTLYLRLTPTGSGVYQFAIAIGGENNV